MSISAVLDAALADQLPDDRAARTLAEERDTARLAAIAAELRDRGHGQIVTYSRKVFGDDLPKHFTTGGAR